MLSGWVGKIALGDNWGVYAGNGANAPMHRHLAYKVVIGLTGTISVQYPDRPPLDSSMILVRPQEQHALSATGVRVALFYVEPESIFCAQDHILDNYMQRIAEAMKDFDRNGNVRRILKIARDLAAAFAPLSDNLNHARAALVHGQLSIAEVASAAGLSESRFSHLFKEQIGVPPSRYRRWARLRQATNCLARGVSITEAALESGFSDAAHLNRTFTEMLGITPGIFSASELIVVPPGDS